ncbi:unnamed protein product, partial [Effrenium voratum]
ATRLVSDALSKAKDNKDRIAKRVATAKRSEKRDALFKKYDKDGDGLWNRAEIQAYAKGEFNFELPAENLERIMRQVCRGEGASMEALQLLKVSVCIARDEERGKAKRAVRLEKEREEREARERREAEIRARHSEFSSECQALLGVLQKLDPDIASAEAMAEALVQDANGGQIKEADARARLGAIEAVAQKTHSAIAGAQLQAQGLSAKFLEDKEVAELMAPELAALKTKTESQDLALRKALASGAQARQLALNRAFAAYENLRMEVAAKLRVCIETQGGKPDDLYDAIKASSGTKVTKRHIKAYLQANQSLIEDEKLDSVFLGPSLSEKAEDENDEPEISREDFMRVVRVFYKVVTEIVLSDNLLIEQSEQLRRMEVGEIMEVFQGPMLDPSVGVYRIHGKALKDGIVGWVTVAGNQGITFLMPGGNLLKVVRPVQLTEMEDVETAGRLLVEGEVLEVIAWQRIREQTPQAVTRVKGRLQGEMVTGWVSMSENGVPNLEVL